MNTVDNIEKKVIEIVAKNLSIDESKITLDSKFTEDLGADSLGTVELMMALEAECGVDIPDEEATKIKTVSDVIKYIQEHQSKSA